MKNQKSGIEIWGGIECTINRVKEDYFDQSDYAGHYDRGTSDIDLVATLGVKMLRYPVLWERHLPLKGQAIDWSFAESILVHMRDSNITPIAGLVHHGSGPKYVNFFDGSFEHGLAEYAKEVATKFPWIEYYTPVNEPLTTARFCGLYGHWYPHGQSDYSFYKVLLSECKATIMAMSAIREINPNAKLIQTEDLGKCYSTPLLAYQRDFENHRRWLSYDLLCGRVNKDHYMWSWLIKAGITPGELLFFQEHSCVPHIAGFNYYITSERYLDEDMSQYPEQYHGGNYRHQYADIETVKVHLQEPNGPEQLLREAWAHLQLPMAITECHLHSTREDQLRWFNTMWKTVNKVKEDGVDIRAITAWAIFGLYGWNCLVTKPGGDYEPGVFNLGSGYPKPTALARLLQELTQHQVFYHPVLDHEGWWQRESRERYGTPAKVVSIKQNKKIKSCRPLLVFGSNSSLRSSVVDVCVERNIHHFVLDTTSLDITNKENTALAISELQPWGLIITNEYRHIDGAESDAATCMSTNCNGPAVLAEICKDRSIQYMGFSTDRVFDGSKHGPYTEIDAIKPDSFFGHSKATAESLILQNNEQALIIRTTGLFGPWDVDNYIIEPLIRLREEQTVEVSADVLFTPTYMPDLVHASIDLMLDGEQGIVHITNGEVISQAGLLRRTALMAGLNGNLIHSIPSTQIKGTANQSLNDTLASTKGVCLPSLSSALDRYLKAQDYLYQAGKIAV